MRGASAETTISSQFIMEQTLLTNAYLKSLAEQAILTNMLLFSIAQGVGVDLEAHLEAAASLIT